MDDENNSVSSFASNTAQDHNLSVEDDMQMLKTLRKERTDIIKQKIKNQESRNIIQEKTKAQEIELKQFSELQSELELQNKKLKEVTEGEIHAKLCLENDVEDIKRMTDQFGDDLSQLQNTVQVIEGNTENIRETQATIRKKILNYLNEQDFKEKCYEEEIKNMEMLFKIENGNGIKEIQEKELTLVKQQKELTDEEEQELNAVLEQEKSITSQLETEEQKKRSDTVSFENELAALQIKFSEEKATHNINQMVYEPHTQTLKTNKTEKEKSSTDLKQKINSSKQEQEKINEETAQVQSDLSNLEIEQEKQETILANLLLKRDEIKLSIIQNQEERNAEIISLEEQVKIATKSNENFKELHKKNQQQREDKMKVFTDKKEKLFEKNQEQEELIKQLEDTHKKNKENSLDYEKTINEYKNKIAAAQLRNKEKKEAHEVLKKKLEDKQNVISNIKDIIKNKTDEKNSMMHNRISVLKSFKEELKSLKENIQLSSAELENYQKTKEKNINLTDKNHREKINKIDTDIRQFQAKMDTLMKNNHDKYIKEKNYLEECTKTMNLQVKEIKTSKENLQEEIAKKIEEILDMRNKIEDVINKIKLKKSEPIFKSPNLPTRTRKTRIAFVTSTPKTILKKSSEKPEILTQKALSPISENENLDDSFNENFPLTQKNITTNFPKMSQKPETKKVEFPIISIEKLQSLEPKTVETTIVKSENLSQKNMSPLFLNENDDSSDENFQLTQKLTTNFSKNSVAQKPATNDVKFSKISVSQKPETNKVEFPLSPIGKYVSLTSDFDKIKKSTSKNVENPISQTKKWQSVSLWPTDNETSDDGFNKNLVTSTQKPASKTTPVLGRKKQVYDFFESENTENENDNKSKVTKQETKKFEISLTQRCKTKKASGNDSSDDSFFGKLKKSKKVQSNVKESAKPITTTINLDTSTSD